MQYEMTFIVFGEDKIKLVKDILAQTKANILFENPMGRRNFAYVVKKQRGGIYHNLYFTAMPKDIESIDKALRSERDIVRYLIIKNEEDIEEIKAKIQRMKQKKDNKKIVKEIVKPQIKKELSLETDPAEIKVSKKSKTVSGEVKPVAKTTSEKKLTETKKIAPKVIKKEKKVIETKTEKTADDQERIKKLEEKLDELLKD